jgi:cathepsin L
MRTIIATLAVASIAFGNPIWKQEFTDYDNIDHRAIFHAWKSDFNRTYANPEEEVNKYLQFLENLKFICSTNAEGLTYKLRLNQFGDMDGDEFRTYVHGPSGSCMRPPSTKPSNTKLVKTMKDPNAPASIDWTDYNGVDYVTPVKNQGSCGSCWAFATTGSLECRYAINKGSLVSLSEQQLVDCSTSYGNYGCDGGWWYNAYAYIEAVKGLCTEAEYPYKGVDGTCKQSSCGTYYDDMTAYADVTADDETDLLNAVATGCVAVGVEADQSSFQFYSSGVLTGNCGTNIDHGVLAVGYGSSNGVDYWKVKNSWGTSWGDEGYIYICRSCSKNGAEGECGINMYPAYPNAFA